MNREFSVSALGFGKVSRTFDAARQVERWVYDDDPTQFLEISVSEFQQSTIEQLTTKVLAWLDACDGQDS